MGASDWGGRMSIFHAACSAALVGDLPTTDLAKNRFKIIVLLKYAARPRSRNRHYSVYDTVADSFHG